MPRLNPLTAVGAVVNARRVKGVLPKPPSASARTSRAAFWRSNVPATKVTEPVPGAESCTVPPEDVGPSVSALISSRIGFAGSPVIRTRPPLSVTVALWASRRAELPASSRSNSAPLPTAMAALCTTALPRSARVPPLTVSGPEKGDAAVSARVPAPSLVSATVPVTLPFHVASKPLVFTLPPSTRMSRALVHGAMGFKVPPIQIAPAPNTASSANSTVPLVITVGPAWEFAVFSRTVPSPPAPTRNPPAPEIGALSTRMPVASAASTAPKPLAISSGRVNASEPVLP